MYSLYAAADRAYEHREIHDHILRSLRSAWSVIMNAPARIPHNDTCNRFVADTPIFRTSVSQTAQRLLSGSLRRLFRILSCFVSRFFCIDAGWTQKTPARSLEIPLQV